MRSYGSTLWSRGPAASSPEPSIGAHWTSAIGIASRLLSASESRPSTCIRPTSRHSSVSPSKATPAAHAAQCGHGAAAAASGRGLLPPEEVEGHPATPPPSSCSRGSSRRRRRRRGSSCRRACCPAAMSRSRRRMILPERVLGRSGVNISVFGFAIGLIFVATCLRSSSPSSGRRLDAEANDDEREDRLAGDRVGCADDRRLGDGRVGHERALDLGGREAVAGDVHHVVDAAEEPEVAVLVALRPVTREVHPREAAPVRLLVALGVAVDAAEHCRPGPLQDEVAAAAERDAACLRRRQRRPRCRGTGRSPSRAWSS